MYLTRNGHGQCAIIDMKELDELDKQKALYQLMISKRAPVLYGSASELRATFEYDITEKR